MRESSVSAMTAISAVTCTHSEVLARAGYNELQQKFEQLRTSKALQPNQLPRELPTAGGIYLFLYHDTPFYVGRSKNLQQRYNNHTAGDTSGASLATKMARRGAGIDATYKKGTSAIDLYTKNISGFKFYFDVAREKIKLFNVQYIVEPNDIVQSLLELYVIVRLGLDSAGAYNQLKTS